MAKNRDRENKPQNPQTPPRGSIPGPEEFPGEDFPSDAVLRAPTLESFTGEIKSEVHQLGPIVVGPPAPGASPLEIVAADVETQLASFLQKARCGDCLYAGVQRGVTVCRHSPPGAGSSQHAQWPGVDEGDWCGSFIPKRVPAGGADSGE